MLELRTGLSDAKDETLDQAAEEIVTSAKSVCPVDTGTLRNSLAILDSDDDSRIVGSDVEYAPFVEFGTYKQRPQSFMSPFVNEMRTRLPQLYIDKIGRLIK